MVEWTIDELTRHAQAQDNTARRARKNEDDEWYSRHRKLAFDARKWAREKVKND